MVKDGGIDLTITLAAVGAAKIGKVSKAGGAAVGLVEDGIRATASKIVKMNDELVASMRATFGEDLAFETRAIKSAASEIDDVARAAKTPLEKISDPLEARAAKAEAGTRRNIQDHEGVSGVIEGKQVGHTILKHVGKSEKWLQNRIIKEGVPSVSSFHNEAVGNRTIGKFKKQYETEINQWLKNGGEKPFQATIDMKEDIGLVVNVNKKGMPLTALEATKAEVVLVKDNSEWGWHLFTVKLQK